MTIRGPDQHRPFFRFPRLKRFANRTACFPCLFAYRPARKLNVMVQGQAEVTSGEYVSGDYFRGLGVVPAAGRLIVGDDDRAGAPGVVVLSYGFAQRRFGDAASAVGRQC